MNGRTQAIIGATVVLLGVGVVLLSLLEDDARVRQVADVVADPSAHFASDFVLIGTPQPPELTSAVDVRPNDLYRNTTSWQTSFDGGAMHVLHTMNVEQTEAGSSWSYSNRTQVAGRPDIATWTNATWFVPGEHTVFLIQGFADANGDTPWIWGVYEGVVREPIQPKPWQFTGRLVDRVGDATVPDGAMVFYVDSFATQCSSKFLPDDHEAAA